MKQFVLLLSLICHHVNSKTPINLLVLVPWPNSNVGAGWDGGIDMIPGGRVAMQEINNRTDVLSDYQINLIEAGHESCGLTVHSLGLLNIVNSAIYPPANAPVAAIMGLFCSTSASALSPLAGREGVDLLQFSSANSPFFHTNDSTEFPHMWKFLEPAYVYAKMMVHMIRQYNWSSVAVVSSQSSVFFDGIAAALVHEIAQLDGTRISYQGQLINLIEDFENQVLSDLVEAQSRIVFISADRLEINSLLCKAYERNMTYPKYLWILPDKTPQFLFSPDSPCNESTLIEVLEGAVLATYNLIPDDDQIIEFSGNDYKTFKDKYNEELEIVKEEYSEVLMDADRTANGDVEYAAFLYDEIWAFALALNNSLPTLSANGFSIKDYSFGQANFTTIIENSLRNLWRYRGITGYIKFNRYKEVRTPINIAQFINGTGVIVNKSVVFDENTGVIVLQLDPRFDDEIPVHNQTYVLPMPVMITMGICAFGLLIFITVVLGLLLFYRKKREIKALSMNVSCLMFVGCYFIVAGLMLIVVEMALLQERPNLRVTLCSIQIVLFLNGTMLVFFMLCLKLFRLYQIFENKKLQQLGYFYNNVSLIIMCLILVAVPDVVLVIVLILFPIRIQQTIETQLFHLQTVNTYYPYCHTSDESGSFIATLVFFMGIVMVVCVVLASRVKKITNRDFRNKRTVNILALLIFATYVLLILVNELVLTIGPSVSYKTITLYLAHFCVVVYCQILLFVPNLVRVIRRDPPPFASALYTR